MKCLKMKCKKKKFWDARQLEKVGIEIGMNGRA